MKACIKSSTFMLTWNSEKYCTCTFYIVSRAGKTHLYQLCRHIMLALLTIHSIYILTSFFSSYSVSYGLVDFALTKLRQRRIVWSSLLHTYPQSLLYPACRRKIITKCTNLKKDDPCCGNS